jgi:hypothetical protein
MRKLGPIILMLATCWTQSALCSDTPPGGVFHGCPVKGNSGDLLLNALKNRTAQASSPTDITIDDILGLASPTVVTPVVRSKWTPKNRQLAAAQEGRSVVLTGFLLSVRQQGPERCNCGDPEVGDFHIWIAPEATSKKASAIVVEVTPRWQEANDSWDLMNLQDLAHKKAKVRISGWLLYDQDHGSEVGKSRATLWELHPVTKIEVEDASGWHEL